MVMLVIGVLLVGGFNPSEKNISQLELLFPISGKITHVPNQQTENVFMEYDNPG